MHLCVWNERGMGRRAFGPTGASPQLAPVCGRSWRPTFPDPLIHSTKAPLRGSSSGGGKKRKTRREGRRGGGIIERARERGHAPAPPRRFRFEQPLGRGLRRSMLIRMCVRRGAGIPTMQTVVCFFWLLRGESRRCWDAVSFSLFCPICSAGAFRPAAAAVLLCSIGIVLWHLLRASCYVYIDRSSRPVGLSLSPSRGCYSRSAAKHNPHTPSTHPPTHPIGTYTTPNAQGTHVTLLSPSPARPPPSSSPVFACDWMDTQEM